MVYYITPWSTISWSTISWSTISLQSFIFESFNLHNMIQEATRSTISSRTLLDLFVTTTTDLISSSGVFPLGLSDHDLIYATIRLKHNRPPPKFIKTRNYKRIDFEKFKYDLECTPFYIASIFEEPDDQLWVWERLFDDISNEHAPWREIKARSFSSPWITCEIRHKMNRRYKLFKAAISSKCPEQWSNYKRVRNEVTSDLRKAKSSYFSTIFNEVKSSSAYWNLLKRSTNPKVRKNIGKFKYDLECTPFYIASIFEEPDDQLWVWERLFDDISNEHAPWREIKARSFSSPWITCEIRHKMNRRYKLFKVAISSKCPEQWSNYKRVRNEVTSDLRKAKSSYFSTIFNEVKSSSAYWNLLKRSTNPKVRKNIGPLKREDGTLELTDPEKANLMNSYFATIGLKLSNTLPPPTNCGHGKTCTDNGARQIFLNSQMSKFQSL